MNWPTAEPGTVPFEALPGGVDVNPADSSGGDPFEQTGEPISGTSHSRFADLLLAAHRDRLLYVEELGWHQWDGRRWKGGVDDASAIHATNTMLKAEWARSFDDKDYAREISRASTGPGMNSIVTIARSMPEFRCRAEDLDADPHLINCSNGTLDLRTGELRPHDPGDRITKLTHAAFDLAAMSDEWDGFLARVLPDPEVRAYLQRFAGISLSGVTAEHIFGIATGTGANGKGTFYTALLHALGDYGHAAEAELFMIGKQGANSASPAQMALRGTRFVICSETEEGQPLAAALMKRLTGGDPITARQLFRPIVTFQPTFTALLVTNHLPKVRGDDDALWRRVRVIPFEVVIPEADRDGGLPERLHLAADAILGWAYRGYLDWKEHGMAAPEAVLVATSDYRTASDDIRRFIEERCVIGSHFAARSGDLHEAYTKWAGEEGAEPMTGTRFGRELERCGYVAAKESGVRVRRGLALHGIEADEE